MGLDYTFQIAVPRQEALGALQDIAAFCLEEHNNDGVILDGQQVHAPFGYGRELKETDPHLGGLWMILPLDDILRKRGRRAGDEFIIPGDSAALFTELSVFLDTDLDEVRIEFAAVTTGDSIILEQSSSFLDAMRMIAEWHNAYYCILDREGNPGLVTWFCGGPVDVEIDGSWSLQPRTIVETMVRTALIERTLTEEIEVLSWESTLFVAMANPDPDVQAVAARLLGEHAKCRPADTETAVTSTAVDLLITAAHDTDATVRNSAIEALGKVGDERAVPAIEDALDDPETLDAALQAICHIKSPEADAAIEKALAHLDWDASDSSLRYATIVAAAGERKLTDAAPILCAKANATAKTSEMHVVIVKALGLIGDPGGIGPALRLMAKGKGLAPCYAIWALRDIGDASALPELEGMLSHNGSGVREAARQAIAAIKARLSSSL